MQAFDMLDQCTWNLRVSDAYCCHRSRKCAIVDSRQRAPFPVLCRLIRGCSGYWIHEPRVARMPIQVELWLELAY